MVTAAVKMLRSVCVLRRRSGEERNQFRLLSIRKSFKVWRKTLVIDQPLFYVLSEEELNYVIECSLLLPWIAKGEVWPQNDCDLRRGVQFTDGGTMAALLSRIHRFHKAVSSSRVAISLAMGRVTMGNMWSTQGFCYRDEQKNLRTDSSKVCTSSRPHHPGAVHAISTVRYARRKHKPRSLSLALR
nr:hypothetical protein CFP56_36445 [Quercus suber]